MSLCVARYQTSLLVYSVEARSILSLPNQRVACTINERKTHRSLVCLWNHWTENKGWAGGLRTHSQNFWLILYVLHPVTGFRDELSAGPIYMWRCIQTQSLIGWKWWLENRSTSGLLGNYTPPFAKGQKGSTEPDGALANAALHRIPRKV